MGNYIGILASLKNSHADLVEQALEKRGVIAKRFPITEVIAGINTRNRLTHGGEDLCALDALLVRSVPGGSLEQVIFRMDRLYTLQRNGVRVFNSPAAIEKTVDKYYTSALLQEQSIPTPPTVVVEKVSQAMEAFQEMKDVVVKPLFGSMGNGILRVDDEEVAHRVFTSLGQCGYVYYLQQYIPHDCEDIRAFVIGHSVVAAMLRKGEGWKTNLAKGAKAFPIKLTPEQESLCISAVKAIGADYGGVDLMMGEDENPYIIEVNSIPGWLGLQKVTEVDIAGELADYLIQGKST